MKSGKIRGRPYLGYPLGCEEQWDPWQALSAACPRWLPPDRLHGRDHRRLPRSGASLSPLGIVRRQREAPASRCSCRDPGRGPCAPVSRPATRDVYSPISGKHISLYCTWCYYRQRNYLSNFNQGRVCRSFDNELNCSHRLILKINCACERFLRRKS